MAKKLKASFTIRKDMKRKWLAALRGGKYKQGNGYLYDKYDDSYCCLGVLCEVSGVKTASLDQLAFPNNADEEAFPERLYKVPYKGEMVGLDELNDETGLSFKQIANIVERTVDTH